MLPSSKIEDAGDFLPFAAKHREKCDLKSDSTITLKALWPEPSWSDLVDDGLCPFVAAKLAMFYSCLRAKPRKGGVYWKSISSKQWEDGYIDAIERLKLIFNEVKTLDDVKAINDKMALAYGFKKGDKSLYEISKSYPYWSIGRGERTLKAPNSLSDKASYLSKCLPYLDWPESNAAIKLGKFPVEFTNGKYGLGYVEGKSVYVTKKNYDTFDDVIADIKQELNKDVHPAREKIPVKPSVKGLQRIGESRRQGDVSSDQLMSVFGIRAIQFGESMSNKEKQAWLNEVFDALSDLSDVTGLPRKWIGLGGIGLAFGARGKGGALAHYEPELRVINLTREKGAGSLAHEWFHALDNRLGKTVFGYGSVFFSEKAGSSFYSVPDKFSPVRKNFAEIYKKIGRAGGSEFYRRSDAVSRIKGAQSYWTTIIELFARSFESYVQDALMKNGKQSPWLSYGTRQEDYHTPQSPFPYPLDNEREELFHLYELIFASLRKL